MSARFLKLACLALCLVGAPLLAQEPAVPLASPARDHVSVGVYLASLYDTDAATSSFLADFYVWTNQKSGEGASVDPLDFVVFPGSLRQDLLFQQRKTVNGQEWSLRRYRGTFFHDWNLVNFPFDKHLLSIQLRNSAQESNLVDYVPDVANSGFDQELDIPGWRISGFKISAEDVTYATSFGDPSAIGAHRDPFSWITASVVMKREAFQLFVKLMAGGYLSLAAAMLVCFMVTVQPPVFAGRMVVQISSLFSAIISSRATDSILGRDDQFTLPSLLHVLIYVCIFCGLMITLRSRWLCENGKEVQAKVWERRTSLIIILLFVAANIILITRAALSPVEALQ